MRDLAAIVSAGWRPVNQRVTPGPADCYSLPVARSSRKPSKTTARRLIVPLVLLGLVVVLDLVLFGWLIFRSLSQREIEQVLLETRHEAEDIAGQIADRASAEGKDLYTVIAVEKDTRTYIDSVLRQQGVVSSVRVLDKDGALVYEAAGDLKKPVGGGPVLDLERPREVPGDLHTEVSTRRSRYQVEEPIGKFGLLRIGISEEDLQARIAELRHDLISQTATLGVVTTLLLTGAFLLIWALAHRSQRLEEQAAEAERMAYIGTLASGLAHEIRNPLNSLSLNMQMLEEEIGQGGPAPSGGRLLGITRREIARLERLVTDFLSYARPRPLDLEEVAAAELLEQVRELLAGEAASRRVELVAEDRSGGAAVRADPGQMRQLLLNLAQNALTAAEEARRGDGGRRGRVTLGAERRGGWVDLLVEDDGRGIPPEDLDRIFDVFFSTRKGGTGLGLAIVDRIAKNHGGTVEVASEPDAGTTVRVSLPAAGERGQGEAKREAPADAAAEPTSWLESRRPGGVPPPGPPRAGPETKEPRLERRGSRTAPWKRVS